MSSSNIKKIIALFSSIMFVLAAYANADTNLSEKIKNAYSEVSTSLIMLNIFVISLILLFSAVLILIFLKKSLSVEIDNITGIPTYIHFEKETKKILSKAKSGEYAILSLNIDNFRSLNNTIGIINGNEILRRLGLHFSRNRLKGEKICRFYADNFIFFIKSPDFFWSIEERVFEMTDVKDLLRDLLPEKYTLNFTSSIYYIEDPRSSVESMVDKANLAQKLQKHTFSTHRVIEYTKEMAKNVEWNREISVTMEKAIENREFEVYFQPKFRFSDEGCIGAEALIRWNNPAKGLLMPGTFVPLFEDNGFIERIDKYVLIRVCVFLEEWAATPGYSPITISFNLSRHHLDNPHLIKELREITDKYDIGNNKIEVELTESIMFQNQQQIINVMNEIKKAGFQVSVDDFGSGYSSLNLLKSIPADVIKLDKGFITEHPEDNKESIIITSVIDMAKKLNITTVAEGVETKNQSELLKNIGCDIVQGFYYAKPMKGSEFRKLLQNS